MMALLAVRCRKTVTGGGKWNERRMTRADFQLSKSKSYFVGASWSWQVWQLASLDHAFRLLVAFNVAKGQYQAWLGFEDGADHALLAKLEFHQSHRGWHLHLRTGPLEDVARGVVKESREHERSRICGYGSGLDVTEANATGIAFRVFNVSTDVGLFK